MKYALGKQLGGGLAIVSVNHGEEEIEITSKVEIENICHKENWKKFTQTNNTPAIMG